MPACLWYTPDKFDDNLKKFEHKRRYIKQPINGANQYNFCTNESPDFEIDSFIGDASDMDLRLSKIILVQKMIRNYYSIGQINNENINSFLVRVKSVL